MGKISLSWDDPATREDGSPLAPGEFAGVKVEMRSAGADFKLLDMVKPGGQGHGTADLPFGDYEFRVTPVDSDGHDGAPASVTVTIHDDAVDLPPEPAPRARLSAVGNLKAVVT